MSSTGIGPLALGSTSTQLAADLAPVGFARDAASCPTTFLMTSEYQFAVTFDATGGLDAVVRSVDAMEFQGRGSPTPPVVGRAGVTFGSSAADVEAAYPGGTWGVPSFNPDVARIYVVEDGPVTFGFSGDRLTHIVVGSRDVSYEYCG